MSGLTIESEGGVEFVGFEGPVGLGEEVGACQDVTVVSESEGSVGLEKGGLILLGLPLTEHVEQEEVFVVGFWHVVGDGGGGGLPADEATEVQADAGRFWCEFAEHENGGVTSQRRKDAWHGTDDLGGQIGLVGVEDGLGEGQIEARDECLDGLASLEAKAATAGAVGEAVEVGGIEGLSERDAEPGDLSGDEILAQFGTFVVGDGPGEAVAIAEEEAEPLAAVLDGKLPGDVLDDPLEVDGAGGIFLLEFSDGGLEVGRQFESSAEVVGTDVGGPEGDTIVGSGLGDDLFDESGGDGERAIGLTGGGIDKDGDVPRERFRIGQAGLELEAEDGFAVGGLVGDDGSIAEAIDGHLVVKLAFDGSLGIGGLLPVPVVGLAVGGA